MADVDKVEKVSSTSRLPSKSEIPPRLRHRSRCSESENGTPEKSGSPWSREQQSEDDPVTGRENGSGSEFSGGHTETKSQTNRKYSQKESTSGKKPYGSVFSLLGFELTRGYYLAGDESHYEERRERVYTFMSTPLELEKFLMFGFLQCVDTFLFFAAFLPIRIFIAFVHLLSYPCAFFFNSIQGAQANRGKSPRFLQPAQVCDLLKGLLLGFACFCVDFIDTSRMYHLVRGQSVIKLYVFYNMLDLADRLVSGAGQDMLDALYWTATEPGRKRHRVIFVGLHFVVALIYILVHTVLIMGQATVLNVAFNSHNKALLTIMISNNFVEIKSSLFKRMDKNNLLQISCSDAKERFHYSVLLFVVFIRNMTELNWNPDHLGGILIDTAYVGAAEAVVDWVKHAFITKFNEISSETYRTFKLNLAQDILTSQDKHAYTDYSDQVCRRLGLTPIPLVCLLVQVCSKAIHITGIFTYVLLALLFLCLVCTKVLTSILLLSWSCRLLEGAQEDGHQTDPCNIDSQVLAKKDVSSKDASAKDKNAAEKTNAQKPSQDRSFNGGQSFTSVETLPGNLGSCIGGEGESHVSDWRLQSSSDVVVDQQFLNLQRNSTPVKQSQPSELFAPADSWEVESVDSDSEFHSSVDDSVAAHPKTVTGVPVVDYDEEKKYK